MAAASARNNDESIKDCGPHCAPAWGRWSDEPWRNNCLPEPCFQESGGCPLRQPASHRDRIHASFFWLQSPAVFAKWRDGKRLMTFVFSSSRRPDFLVNRRDLRTAAEGLPRFINSGRLQFPNKTSGPLLWQLAPTERFDAAEVDDFLGGVRGGGIGSPCLTLSRSGTRASWRQDILQIAREHRVATVFEADTAEHPRLRGRSADFIYARLMRTVSTPNRRDTQRRHSQRGPCGPDNGHPAKTRVTSPRVQKVGCRKDGMRDVFMFFISGAKERAQPITRSTSSLCWSDGAG